ncbi:YqjF family protein [Terrabacter aeriphilus]|uniref:YqjF family protein n=1 Tax=Terrabacter aeriphilus TaxID=515662 RepID=A0ABP9J559_9MICO
MDAAPASSAALEGYPVTPPALRRPVVFDQVWRDLTFVHWPVDPDAVAPFFPAGTRPDVFADGRTYAALVPFVMDGIRLGRAPSPRLPWLGSFLETNIRLYSVDDAGRHGVLFRSLETERALVVLAARAGLGIPYTWARMRLERDGDVVTYESRRWAPARGLRSRLSVRVGQRVEPTPLETWLTARWGAHTRVAGRTIWVPNEHEPWPLHEAEVVGLDDDLLGASGVTATGPRLRALWSPGVATRFGRPSRVA